jgi:hypothetical protein
MFKIMLSFKITMTQNVGFEVPTAVVMKRTTFWNIRWKSTYVSEEHITSIFIVEEYANSSGSWQDPMAGCCEHGDDFKFTYRARNFLTS